MVLSSFIRPVCVPIFHRSRARGGSIAGCFGEVSDAVYMVGDKAIPIKAQQSMLSQPPDFAVTVRSNHETLVQQTIIYLLINEQLLNRETINERSFPPRVLAAD